MSVAKLKEVIESCPVEMNVEVIDHFWFRTQNEIRWNTGNCVEDLDDRDGETYSVEYYHGTEEWDGYLVVPNANDGCGNTVTMFFNLKKEIP